MAWMAWKKLTCSRPSSDFFEVARPTCAAWTQFENSSQPVPGKKRLARAALAAYSQCRLFLLRHSVELGCKPIGVPAAPKRAILRC